MTGTESKLQHKCTKAKWQARRTHATDLQIYQTQEQSGYSQINF